VGHFKRTWVNIKTDVKVVEKERRT